MVYCATVSKSAFFKGAATRSRTWPTPNGEWYGLFAFFDTFAFLRPFLGNLLR